MATARRSALGCVALGQPGDEPVDAAGRHLLVEHTAVLFNQPHADDVDVVDLPAFAGLFQPITSAQFLAEVRTDLLKGDAALARKLLLDDWVYQPGLPANAVAPRSAALERVTTQAGAFARGTPAASLVTRGWSTQEWQHFLGNLPEMLTAAQLAGLDSAFTLTASGNSEVLFAWLRIAIRHRYQPAMPALERFLTTQGRRKVLRPLFEDLMKQEWGKAVAKRIYAAARPLYHSVATGTLDPIVAG
jgi:hypothetical protein